MKGKKIGIITLYYKNNNYGGVAQAYALNEYFNKIGYDSELISYDKKKSNLILEEKKLDLKTIIKKAKNKLVKIFIAQPIEKIQGKKIQKKLLRRTELLEEFRNNIKHSKVYNANTIKECKENYDYFVTGSDQCWKPGVIDDNMVFNFINSNNKSVFSYAPSIANENLSEKYKEFMKKSLKKYKAISVREEQSVLPLREITGKDVKCVVDPTLLLEREDWEKVTDKKIIEGDYIFAYMLGDSIKQRKEIEKFAKEKNMKLVTIPHIKDGNKFSFRFQDFKFGDIQMLDISLEQFFSLIKYSKYVITDSFHAVIFSYIFQKEFYVLERNSVISMSSRVKSLLSIMNLKDRLIKTNRIIEKDSIDFEEVSHRVNKRIEESKEYIKNALSFE